MPNKATAAIRTLADDLLGDPAYWPSLKARIMAGEAPGMELLLWTHRFGRPRTEAAVCVQPDPLVMRKLGDDVAERLAALAERLGPSARARSALL